MGPIRKQEPSPSPAAASSMFSAAQDTLAMLKPFSSRPPGAESTTRAAAP